MWTEQTYADYDDYREDIPGVFVVNGEQIQYPFRWIAKVDNMRVVFPFSDVKEADRIHNLLRDARSITLPEGEDIPILYSSVNYHHRDDNATLWVFIQFDNWPPFQRW